MIKLIVVWLLAAFFGLHSVVTTIKSNFNMGTVMLWLFFVVFAGFGIFHKQIETLTKHGLGKTFKIVFLAGLAFFVFMFVFVAISGYTNTEKGDEKAIIVLGAGLNGKQVSNVLARRLQAGLAAWQKNQNAYLVVTGGQGLQEIIPEAVAMKKWLISHGVPENKIVLEDKSTSTEENLAFSKKLLLEKDISSSQPVAIVSNAFHCYRARQYAQKLGFEDARTVPATISATTILPSYMREVFAILYMWVFKQNLA